LINGKTCYNCFKFDWLRHPKEFADAQGMNFLKISDKVTLIFLYAVIFLFAKPPCRNAYAYEPGIPYIQTFFIQDFGFNSKNHSFAKNREEVIFIGNFNRILEYNGADWISHSFPGKPFLTSTNSGVVYAGGANAFGFFSKNESGQNSFVPLLLSAADSAMIQGQILSLKSIGEDVFFTTRNALVLSKNNSFKRLDSFSSSPSLFCVDSVIIVSTYDEGLLFYKESGKHSFPSGNFFIGKTVIDVLPYFGKYLVKTLEDQEFFLADHTSARPFHSSLTDLFTRHGYVAGVLLDDGNYAFGTEKGGLLIMDTSGNLINHIRRDHGLLEERITSLSTDLSGNLWLLHNNGISRIEVPSPFAYFDRTYGLRGTVSSITRHRGTLYFATSQGVFRFTNKQGNSFAGVEEISGVNHSCFGFHSLGGELYAFSEGGIYHVSGRQASLLLPVQLETASLSGKNPYRIYLGLSDGLAVTHFYDGIWQNPETLIDTGSPVLSIAEENQDVLWLGTDAKGLYRITAEGDVVDYQLFQDVFPNTQRITALMMVNTSRGVLFSTSSGIFRYDQDAGGFYPDSLIGLDFETGNYSGYSIREDNSHNLWLIIYNRITRGDEAYLAQFSGSDKTYDLIKIPFQRKKEFHIRTIYPDSEGVVWFGGFNGVVRFDTNSLREKERQPIALINKVTWNRDSVVYYDQNSDSYKNKKGKFRFSARMIRFDFSTTSYESAEQALFQSILVGFDKDWSDWNAARFREYTNLPGKEYTFKVKVKDLNGKVSEASSFSFRIFQPVYKTKWAFFYYFLLLAAFIHMLIRKGSLRFAKEKFKLEKIINKRTEELLKQKEKSEELLARVLPRDTANEIKSTGRAASHKYEMVTVLFSDIEGFTRIAEQMNPEILIDELDKFFFKFDSVVEKFNIEKIKTIGDAYMCAGGIPDKNRTNPVEVVMAALEMIEHMKLLQKQNAKIWDLRIGIHTGPVIAGVVGQKKLSYDIWGDTVNTASRMESSGKSGKINVSGSTYEMVKDFFVCEHRGMMPVKYKGNIDMYFVKGYRPELSLHGKGIEPNELFFQKLQLLRMNDLEDLIFNRLENELPSDLTFHTLQLAKEICRTTEFLADSENLSEQETLILRTASAFLFTGFIKDYKNNTIHRCSLAKEILPGFKYSQEQISEVCSLLSVSPEDLKPSNRMEMILFDAYFEFFGKPELVEMAYSLFKEQKTFEVTTSKKAWLTAFISLLENHEFFTPSASKRRRMAKADQIARMRALLA
jgi:class 3 adenylate cyclase/ligand-binding sensor domain-containing protein